MQRIIGAVVGAAGGATGGFVCALVELSLRRAANRARIRRGEPPRRDEILPRMWMLGGLSGAAIGVVLAGELIAGAAAATLVPFAILLAVRLAGRFVACRK